jgi:hypothetical protein
VDQELERARRAVSESPEDLAASIRLATVNERLGLFRDAWTVLVRLSGRTDDEPSLLRALAGLAKRNPAAAVGYLAACEPDRARFSCLVLGRAGALLPLVVFACGNAEAALVLDAQIALRRAIAAVNPGLPGVAPFLHYLTTDSSREWNAYVPTSIVVMRNYGHDELLRELGSTPEQDREFLAGTISVLPGLMGPLGTPHRHDRAGWTTLARDLVSRARSEKRYELLPWVRSAAAARDSALASEAVAAFQELTGRPAPPLDPVELARLWV